MTDVRDTLVAWRSRAGHEVGFTMLEAKARAVISGIDDLLKELDFPNRR